MDVKKISQACQKSLDILSDGEWHHGSKISEVLELSRTAVWKHINVLKSLGYEIDVSKAKGYRLTKPNIPLSQSKIENYLIQLECKFPSDIEFIPVIASTNDYLKGQTAPLTKPHICLSEQQLQGRGRFNRVWCSPFGENIYLSIKSHLGIPFTLLSGFSLSISLAIVRALSSYGFMKELFQLKWPNDVLVQGHKLAGVLIELSGEAGSDVEAIIGIGVNINMICAEIENNWSSLCHYSLEPIDRNLLVAHLISETFSTIAQFKLEGFSPFYQLWQQHDPLKGKLIELSFYNSKIQGICLGIDDNGNILLKHNDATIKSYSAGEVSFKS